MRMMMRVSMSTEKSNAALTSGRLTKTMTDFIDTMKPEAAYFTADGGVRTAYFFIDMNDPRELPSIAEPMFLELGARVELIPAMNAEEMQVGVQKAMDKR